jgi:hypothetical protein
MSPLPTPRHTVDQIVEEYRRGDRVIAIATRHGVSDTVVSKYAHRAGLSRPKANVDQRPEAPCVHCGRLCRAKYGACADCRIAGYSTPECDSSDILSDDKGRWVRRGLIQVWMPNATVMPRREWRQFELDLEDAS